MHVKKTKAFKRGCYPSLEIRSPMSQSPDIPVRDHPMLKS